MPNCKKAHVLARGGKLSVERTLTMDRIGGLLTTDLVCVPGYTRYACAMPLCILQNEASDGKETPMK